YFYRVRAYNSIGNSDYSNTVNETTDAEPVTVPASPDTLAVSSFSSTQIDLTWTDNSDNEEGFKIEQSTDGSVFSQIITVTADITSFSVTGLDAETQYFYRVRAYNSIGNSDYSNTVNETTDAMPEGSFVSNHFYGTLSSLKSIPESAIENAKTNLHIAYAHTSHGSQIPYGMLELDTFMGNTGLYDWNEGGTDGALDLDDYFVPGDLGEPDRTTWATRTREYLDDPANSDVNVVMWSWCGQASTSIDNIDIYLNLMEGLITDYTDITFIFMTGHLDGGGLNGLLHLANEHIREHCETNNRWLYDFEDIESYDPDGNYFGDKLVNDACEYDSDGNGSLDGNWATEWQDSHTRDVDWYYCSAAHSEALNGNQKTYAAWWLWARLAGWDGN
ncbi:MAG: fibronectin type III domain-containing protein, partial [Spirochaetaceae bacterium]|nr:fibronectin type III domain-containing protein [Spirochaetaceae bacterium]